jgi:ABC-type transport system substrate-binding protein
VVVEYTSFAPAGSPAPTAAEALQSLHVNASCKHSDFGDYISRLLNHGDYDMVFHTTNFYESNVEWLAYDYWSEYADVPEQNPCNFRNATYDAWRDQLLYGVSYEEVFEAAAEMQRILHENVPRLIVYQNRYVHAYRNDVFTGHIEDSSQSIAGPWTLRKIHRIDGSPGGTVTYATGEAIDSFNFMVTDSSFSRDATRAILDCLNPSLFVLAPDLSPWPVLVEHMRTDTHSSNPTVPEGHIRFTLDLVSNATWSDGTPLTAEDVAFTFTYLAESSIYGNAIAASVLPDLIAAYSTTPYRAIIEYGTESYWHFDQFAYNFILPKHIFNNDTGIGYTNWNIWNPVFDPAEPFVTSGPFVFSDFESDSWYQISANPGFFYYPQSVNETTTSITSTTTNTNIVPWNLHPLSLLAGVVSGASVIIIAYTSWNIWVLKRK